MVSRLSVKYSDFYYRVKKSFYVKSTAIDSVDGSVFRIVLHREGAHPCSESAAAYFLSADA